MNSLISALLLLSIVAVAYGHEYKVTVNLGEHKFAHDNVDGSVKMKIHNRNGYSDTFRLIQTTLKPNGFYESTMEINYRLPEINKVSIYFTLTNPFDPRYLFKKPTIYLREIVISSNERIFAKNTKVFKPANPARAIKLKEEVFLNLFLEY